VGITDHNSAANAGAVVEAARGTGLWVLPGMEVETREEVHVLSLFGQVARAEALQDLVYARLPARQNDEAAFGVQLVVDAEDTYVRHEKRLLLVASSLGLVELADHVGRLGGICIPAHVDRPSYGLVGVLGFVPPEPVWPALEVSRHARPEEFAAPSRAVIRSSDAHELADLGTATTTFYMEAPSLDELLLACRHEAGRSVGVP
jgi:hypothetical protein